MAAIAASGLAVSCKDLEFLYHHVFLPPKLPQVAEDSESLPRLESTLTKSIIDTLKVFRNYFPTGPSRFALDTAIDGLLTAGHATNTNDGTLSEVLLLQALLDVSCGKIGVLPLYIRAQNAGLFVARGKEQALFEAFEVSACNRAVVNTTGRLIRQFPGCAVSVEMQTLEQAAFRKTIAQALSKMSGQSVPGMQPKAAKAGSLHDEERDTPHPAAITELFVGGFLKGFSPYVHVQTISKNMRDEVLWNDAGHPWRRSAMWTFIRVFLQVTLSRRAPQFPSLYKTFMAFFMTRLLGTAKKLLQSTEMLYVMSAKIFRRTHKLPVDVPITLRDAICEVLRSSGEVVSNRWEDIRKQNERHLDLSKFRSLDFGQDTLVPIPKLDAYLDWLSQRQPSDRTSHAELTAGLARFDHNILPSPSMFADNVEYKVANLQGFENWVSTSAILSTTWLPADQTCELLHDLLIRYHEEASKVYTGNAEARSVMLLTCMELWMALDKRADSHCNLLKKYDPGVPEELLQNLLLPSRSQMDRLLGLEKYLADRRNDAHYDQSKLFGSITHKDCFAARYFDEADDSQELKTCLEAIVSEAGNQREKKVAELQRLRKEYDRLIQLRDESKCDTIEVMVTSLRGIERPELKHDDTNCRRCGFNERASLMKITLHEWPLSQKDSEAKATVFELRLPAWFGAWRDSTVFLLREVLHAVYTEARYCEKQFRLSKDPHLGSFYKQRESERISLRSESKAQAQTHYRRRFVAGIQNEEQVCVQNGFNYRYADTDIGYFTTQLKTTQAAAKDCTYRLPERSSSLERFILRPAARPNGPIPNSVVATQTECPEHMGIDEYMELCSIPLGYRIQWLSLALQIHAPGVDLKKEETVLVILQCIYQAGPSSGTTLRATHTITAYTDFARLLVRDLDLALQRIKGNWESANAVLILAALAARILTLSQSSGIQSDCLSFLRSASDVVMSWVRHLRQKALDAPEPTDRSEFRIKAMELAFICVACFDIDEAHLADFLAAPSRASVLVQCSIILAERGFHKAETPGNLLSLLNLRFKRTLYRSYPYLAACHAGLDDAIKCAWPAYEPDRSTGWRPVSRSMDHWLTTDIVSEAGTHIGVHIDLLSGRFFVNGAHLARIPGQYQKHPLYSTLFGTCDVEVMATSTLGMRFSATRQWSDYNVSLSWASRQGEGDLLVQATCSGKVYEVIPAHIFHGEYPQDFEENYVHWYDMCNGVIEFRPKEDPWNAHSMGIWMLRRKAGFWHLSKHANNLLGLRSDTSRHIAEALSPLVEVSQMHVITDAASSQAQVEIPRLQLAFRLPSGSCALLSQEFRGMIIDADQSINTLVGLSSKLLLKHNQTGERLLLIPEGPVSYERYNNHISVVVEKMASVKLHPLQIDELLGRLTDNGSLQCKLYVAYLHALTSSCLSDPLIQKTGTEQALYLLRSAAAHSFEQLTEDNIRVLVNIARLAPGRHYYPTQENRFMQSVQWDAELGCLIQSGGLYKAAESILHQAQRSSIFYPESKVRIEKLSHTSADLLERALIRESTFKVSGFGAEDHCAQKDLDYEARDRDLVSVRAANACIVSEMLFHKVESRHWPSVKAGHLSSVAGSINTMLGPNKMLETEHFKYDSTLLQTFDTTIVRQLPALHATFVADNGNRVDLFSLMMWLCTMAFSSSADVSMLQVVVSLYTVGSQWKFRPPEADCFTPQEGCTGAGTAVREKLKDAVKTYTIPYSDSSEAKLPPKEGESERNSIIRRKEVFERTINKMVREFVDPLQNKWTSEDLPTAKLNKFAAYIKVEFALEEVRRMFKTFRDNAALCEYLGKIEKAVTGLQVKARSVHVNTLSSVTPSLKKEKGYFSDDDLFSGEMPLELSGILPPSALIVDRQAFELAHATPCSTLATLISRLRVEPGGYEQSYLDDLENSLGSLPVQTFQDGESGQLPSIGTLSQYFAACHAYANELFDVLKSAMTSACVGKLLNFNNRYATHHLPRVSASFFLEQLGRHRWHRLSSLWKVYIIQYGLALAAVQRARRMRNAASYTDKSELIKELRNAGHSNWNPHDYPETLLLEIESAILVRDVQEQIAEQMRNPPGSKNSVMQLNMGEGKSSVIVPMVAAALANGSQLVRVVVAKPQSKQMAQMLVGKLGGLLNRRVYFMPFSRAVKLSKSKADAIEAHCRECMVHGGVLLVQPEHILSFRLLGPECYISGKQDIGQAVLQIQDFFDHTTRDIVDESDENFDVKFELIYTMGTQRPIEMTPYRWTVIQQILDLVRTAVSKIVLINPAAVELDKRSAGGFPRIRILEPDVMGELLNKVAKAVCSKGLSGFSVAGQPCAVRDAIWIYITQYELGNDQKAAVEQGPFWSDRFKSTLLLLRGLLASGILTFAFAQKRWRVNYGLTDRTPRTRLAVPYRAKDSPTLRSEFSHPDVVIILTSLSYYYGGLEEEHLFLAFGHLIKSDQASVEYQSWIQDVDMPGAFKHLEGINLRDRPTCIAKVFPPLKYSKGAIDYFLAHIVFPKEMREFPNKMSASGWDIGKIKNCPTTGFSGTNDSRDLLPMDVHQLHLEKQKHTNALVLEHLLQPSNSVALIDDAPQGSGSLPSGSENPSDADRLLRMVMSLGSPPPQVILDVGAQILELDNKGVARAWLSMCHAREKDAAVFCNEADELTVLDRHGRTEPLQTSSFASRLDRCVVYLDEAHTRGIDLKLPQDYQAAVTLGANLTKDRLVQACMRMRQLGRGQTVVFCISSEIQRKIKIAVEKYDEDDLNVMDVLHWAIKETFTEVRRSVPLWVTQGHRFVCQEGLWSEVIKGGRTVLSAEHAKKFLEREAQTVEFRYKPGRDFEVQLKKLTDPGKVLSLSKHTQQRFSGIAKRCELFGQVKNNARRLQEEQERELAPEVEEERVVERGIPAEAEGHRLHQDIINLVETGRLRADSNACVLAFQTLQDTSAAAGFDVSQLTCSTGPSLMATTDFAQTVKKKGAGYMSDTFQRPVRWILSIRQRSNLDRTVDMTILISPFEAQQLMERNIHNSSIAALHLYKPRSNVGYPVLDKLDFYTVTYGTGSLKIPAQISTQLNIFAGQLYFGSYSEYKASCEFLGLLSETAKPGMLAAPDNFILKRGEGVAGRGSGLRQSPVEFLKILLTKVRKNGEDIARTHVGRMLEGQLLTREELDGHGDNVPRG